MIAGSARSRLATTAAVLVGAAAVATGAPSSARVQHAADRNCEDFANQAQAQHYFEDHNPGQDPDQLDGDGNGLACESLPCPCAGPSDPGGGGDGGRGRKSKAIVDHVADGDTIGVRIHGHLRTTRLIGVDTPETVRPGVEVECGGPGASRTMHRLVKPGDRITLFTDPTQAGHDRYGRLLRYAESHHKDLGKSQVAHGHANVYVYDDAFQRLDAYNRAEQRARKAGRGVWGQCGGDFHQPLRDGRRAR